MIKTSKRSVVLSMALVLLLISLSVLSGCAEDKPASKSTLQDHSSSSLPTSSPSPTVVSKSEKDSKGEANAKSKTDKKANEDIKKEKEDQMVPQTKEPEENQNPVDPGNSPTELKQKQPDKPEGVPAKVQLYEEKYFDGNILLFFEEKVIDGVYVEDDYYEINISNITDTSFDFAIYLVDGVTGSEDLMFRKHTAVFTGDGTTAAFYGNEYTLLFTFPDYHSAYPDVTDIEVSGFDPIEGVTFMNNGIPGHGFS